MWITCDFAIIACDLAEVIGSPIALQLLFGIPLAFGVCLTALDVLLVLSLTSRGFRYIEALVIALLALIGGCFAMELLFARPDAGAVAAVPVAADRHRSRHALHRDRHPRRNGHAAQSLPPQRDRTDAPLRTQRTRQARGHTVRRDRLDNGADGSAVDQRSHPDPRGRVLSRRPRRSLRNRRRLPSPWPNVRHWARELAVRDRSAGLGPEFGTDRHARRADRHGGIPAAEDFAGGAAARALG